MLHCQIEQHCIRQLLVSGDAITDFIAEIRKSTPQSKKLVCSVGRHSRQRLHHISK